MTKQIVTMGPSWRGDHRGNATVTTVKLDNTAAESLGMMFVSMLSGTLNKIWVSVESVNGTTTDRGYTVGICKVQAADTDDADFGGADDIESANVAMSALSAGGNEITMAGTSTLTAGEAYCIYITDDTGQTSRPNATDYVNFNVAMANVCQGSMGYNDITSGTNFGGSGGLCECCFGLEVGGEWWGNPVIGSASGVSASTTGHHVVVPFNVPTSFADTYKVNFIRPKPDSSFSYGTNDKIKWGIWTLDGTEVGSTAPDRHYHKTNSSAYYINYAAGDETTLNGGTTYYIGLECANSGTCYLYGWEWDGDTTSLSMIHPWIQGGIHTRGGSGNFAEVTGPKRFSELMVGITEVTKTGGGGTVVTGPTIVNVR